jgi:hypothetical protein
LNPEEGVVGADKSVASASIDKIIREANLRRFRPVSDDLGFPAEAYHYHGQRPFELDRKVNDSSSWRIILRKCRLIRFVLESVHARSVGHSLVLR